VREVNAGTAVKFFEEEILARHGCPRTIIVDNDVEWRGPFAEYMVELGIEVRKSRPFHPQTNGLVERFNGTLKRALGKMSGTNPASWV
jgi:transposase InsO family protein